MPLHDVGYRPWQGKRSGSLAAILVIAATGIKLAWTSRWLRRAVFFAWSPALVFAGSFFVFEQAIDEGRLGSIQDRARVGSNVDGVGILGRAIADALGQTDAPPADRHETRDEEANRTRRAVWSRLMLAFMRSPQAILLAIVVGLVAPALVSRDLRAKAWLIYFTRPVGKFEYVTGKLLILGLLVASITMLPALALWVAGVAVSPSIWVAVTTWDLPVRIIVASLALAIPTVFMALAYSSLTAESRIASFAWFATWAACWIAHASLTTADIMQRAQAENLAGEKAQSTDPSNAFDGGFSVEDAPRRSRRSNVHPRGPGGEIGETLADLIEGRGPRRGRPLAVRQFGWLSKATGLDDTIDRWAWISPYHSLGVIQAWVFGIERRSQAIFPPLISLGLVSIVSALVLWWRVDAPARA
jgi:hypothetical protein